MKILTFLLFVFFTISTCFLTGCSDDEENASPEESEEKTYLPFDEAIEILTDSLKTDFEVYSVGLYEKCIFFDVKGLSCNTEGNKAVFKDSMSILFDDIMTIGKYLELNGFNLRVWGYKEYHPVKSYLNQLKDFGYLFWRGYGDRIYELKLLDKSALYKNVILEEVKDYTLNFIDKIESPVNFSVVWNYVYVSYTPEFDNE